MTVRSSLSPEPHVGTDGVRVFTVEGWGWIFPPSTLDAEWRLHVCKRGDRFAALQIPGLAGLYGSMRPARLGGWPCGWIGSQYLSDHFTNIKFWGCRLRLRPSPSQRRKRFIAR